MVSPYNTNRKWIWIGLGIAAAALLLVLLGVGAYTAFVNPGWAKPKPAAAAQQVTTNSNTTSGTTTTNSGTTSTTTTNSGTTNATSMTWSDFKSFAQGKDTYQLISALDQKPEKQHKDGPWTATTSPNEALLVWTGSYLSDPSYGGNVVSYSVDGQTGVWIQKPGTTVNWQTTAGTIRITNYDGTPSITKNTTTTTNSIGTTTNSGISISDNTKCVSTQAVLKVINANKKTEPNAIYRELDKLVNLQANAATAMRAEGPATYSVANTKALFWVQTGQITGSVLEIDRTEGKSLYLATKDGQVNLLYAHSGVRLCEELNPSRDFPWWGK